MNISIFFRLFLPRLAVVLAVLALLEIAFRAGAWERVTRPESNAGQSVRLKNAVAARDAGNIDFVTLGDSRAVYGIEHQRIADAAHRAGFYHANLSLAGTHWLTIDSIASWIAAKDKNLKGVLIATNVTTFMWEGNGAYEVGTATPFMSSWDSQRMARGVPFSRDDLTTYGVYSALFLAREDVQDLIMHPRARMRERRTYAGQGVAPLTFSAKVAGDACAVPHDSIEACAASASAGRSDTERAMINQCKSELPSVKQRADWRQWRTVPHLAKLAQQRQAGLRALPFPKPMLVLLMPVPSLRRNELMPDGLEEFVQFVLQPLVDDGTIVLRDYTHFFDGNAGGECSAFWDLYHQNTLGQAALTDAILPVIEHELYARAASKSRAAPATK